MLPHSILQLLFGLKFGLTSLVIVNFLPKVCEEVVYLRLTAVVFLLDLPFIFRNCYVFYQSAPNFLKYAVGSLV